MIRGTQTQIVQIRDLLTKLGEQLLRRPDANRKRADVAAQRHQREVVLERWQEIWPSMRQNRIRVVSPSTTIPSVRPNGEEEKSAALSGRIAQPGSRREAVGWSR